jgi:hypothetical protein
VKSDFMQKPAPAERPLGRSDHGPQPPAQGEVPSSSHLRLGELLTRAGLVPAQRLHEALRIQSERNVQLGALLVEMGLLDEVELRAVLHLQSELRTGEASRLTEFVSGRLGSILVDSGALSEGELRRALEEQERSGAPLGEVLVRQGAISRALCDGALGFQRAAARPPERLRLGNLLVESGVITQATLDAALLRQRATGKRIGDTLVEAGAISRETLSAFLQRQRRLIAVAAAGLSLLAAAPVAQAGGSHVIQVEATVLRKAAISALRTPAYLMVTQADVARGYVEVSEPIEVDVSTNNPGGVMLGLQSKDPTVKSAEFLNDGGATSEPLHVQKAGVGLSTQTVRLRARVRLGPDASPGRLAWPLAVFITPA